MDFWLVVGRAQSRTGTPASGFVRRTHDFYSTAND